MRRVFLPIIIAALALGLAVVCVRTNRPPLVISEGGGTTIFSGTSTGPTVTPQLTATPQPTSTPIPQPLAKGDLLCATAVSIWSLLPAGSDGYLLTASSTASCGNDWEFYPTVTPQPEPTLVPTSTPQPTPTLVPTATLVPTPTLVPTATPQPTATPPTLSGAWTVATSTTSCGNTTSSSAVTLCTLTGFTIPLNSIVRISVNFEKIEGSGNTDASIGLVLNNVTVVEAISLSGLAHTARDNTDSQAIAVVEFSPSSIPQAVVSYYGGTTALGGSIGPGTLTNPVPTVTAGNEITSIGIRGVNDGSGGSPSSTLFVYGVTVMYSTLYGP